MKLRYVYSLIAAMILLTVPVTVLAQKMAFEEASLGLAFEQSHRGYGFLAPLSEGSESAVVVRRSLSCNQTQTDEYKSWEQLEKRDVIFLLSIILNSAQPQVALHREFLAAQENSKLFYTTKDKFEKKIYSNQLEEWKKQSEAIQKLSEKYFHLELKATPAENVKAAIMLDILEKKEGSQFKSLKTSLENSFFLMSEAYRIRVRSLVEKLFKLDEGEYQDFISKEERFYLLGDLLSKVSRKVVRSHKLLSRGRSEEAYSDFLEFHKDQINEFKRSVALNGHKLIENQAFAEGIVSEPSCAIEATELQCSSFKRSEKVSELSGLFYLEYFQAWREYKVTEESDEFSIELTLKFFKAADLSQENFNVLLNKWLLWADTFYNQNSGFRGKKVSFHFSFVEAAKEAEDVINLRNCWNASRNSSECSLPSQPNAKNFTVDLKKDVLLEEVGHHMGLFDEYKMAYYHFNALGAQDSFMIASDEYKLYPSHIERILAPHLGCK